MNYTKHLDLENEQPLQPPPRTNAEIGDRRDGRKYVYTDEIVLAVNVAWITGRPLLVRGLSGNGKSSLARNAALRLGWRYYETVITSRTQARDLLWEVDLLRRLHDAQMRDNTFVPDISAYIRPGVLWWAFDRDSAKRRGKRESEYLEMTDAERMKFEASDPNLGANHERAVVLIDEIDKADPDVPNNLLVPLGSLQFQVEETGTHVQTTADKSPLVFITTNEERELPAAFLRRCVQVQVPDPDVDRLVAIGSLHFPEETADFLREIAVRLQPAKDEKLESEARTAKHRSALGVAEYLDTVRACIDLEVAPGSPVWNDLLEMTFLKRSKPGERSDE